MSVTRLSIPPRTSLQTVFRVVDASGNVTWQVYTACHNRNAAYHDMLGTSLIMRSDGSAARHIMRPDDSEHVMEIMPCPS